jgi:hypothetical protein
MPVGKKTGGRVKGTPNRLTLCLRELAREHTDTALGVLVQVAKSGESESARVAAANAILDRGYGKPSQVITGDEDGGAVTLYHRIMLEGVEPDGNSDGDDQGQDT